MKHYRLLIALKNKSKKDNLHVCKKTVENNQSPLSEWCISKKHIDFLNHQLLKTFHIFHAIRVFRHDFTVRLEKNFKEDFIHIAGIEQYNYSVQIQFSFHFNNNSDTMTQVQVCNLNLQVHKNAKLTENPFSHGLCWCRRWGDLDRLWREQGGRVKSTATPSCKLFQHIFSS
jgi:hypothetical protein